MEDSQQILYQQDLALQSNRSGVLRLLAGVGIVLVTIVFLLLTLFGMECPFEYRVLVFFWILLNTVLCVVAWRSTRNKPLLRIIFSFVILYYQLAYTYKTVLMYLPQTETLIYWIGTPSRPSLDILGKVLVLGVIIVTGMYISIILAARISKVDEAFAKNVTEIRFFLLLIICVVFILIKYVVHFVFKWGLPGSEVAQGIPIVTGILVLFSRFGLFFLCSSYLYLSIVIKRDRIHACLAILVTVCYLGMDFMIGSKFSLAYIAVVLFFIVLFFKQRHGLLPKVPLLIAFVFFIFASTFYKYINFFRYARIQGEEIGIINFIDYAISKGAGEQSGTSEIIGRINGMDLFASAVSFSDFMKPSLINLLWSDSLRQEYTTALAGGTQIAHHAVGFTQAGFIALLCRGNVLLSFFATVLIMTFLFVFFIWASLRFIQSEELRPLAAVVLGISLVFLQFSGGGVVFFMKELFITVMCIQLVDKFVLRGDTLQLEVDESISIG